MPVARLTPVTTCTVSRASNINMSVCHLLKFVLALKSFALSDVQEDNIFASVCMCACPREYAHTSSVPARWPTISYKVTQASLSQRSVRNRPRSGLLGNCRNLILALWAAMAV